jgi:iron complex outermembrane receptor protein
MTARNEKKARAVRFTQWSRKPYAVFQSLGKVVHIGVILISYSLIAPTAHAQEAKENHHDSMESDTLPEVEITTSEPGVMMGLDAVPAISTEPERAGSQDAAELALKFPGTDIRQRGINGVQGDISIRGSSPEQVKVLLNGIPLNDPQTGHHNLNLPIPLISLSNAQRFTPISGQQGGSNAFSGVLNFTNTISDTDRLRVWLTGGQHQLLDIGTAADFSTGAAKHHLAYSRKSSEGHSFNTDFRQNKIYLHSQMQPVKQLFVDFQAGLSDKEFGAEGFYSAKYPTQFEATKTRFASGSIHKSGRLQLELNVWLRQNKDRFELFRESLYQPRGEYFVYGSDTAVYVPGIYEAWNYYTGHNYHRSLTGGYRFDAATKTKAGIFKGALEHQHESILSNVLGKALTEPVKVSGEPARYTKKAIRDQINAAFSWKSPSLFDFRASLTGLAHHSGEYGTQSYGGARLQWIPARHFSIWGGINQSMRLPSFTDLYYSGPTNLGNTELKPEEATNYELGLYASAGRFMLRNQAFYQHGQNMIDWVKSPEEDIYTTMNYTNLNAWGNEISATWRPGEQSGLWPWVKDIRLHYTWMNKSKVGGSLISAYAMDYLKHQAGLQGIHQMGNSKLSLNWQLSFNDRNGTYTLDGKEHNYISYLKTDVSISYGSESRMIFLSIDNLTNIRQRDFGNIRLPGRWVTFGIRMQVLPEKRN